MFAWGLEDPSTARGALKSLRNTQLKPELHVQLIVGWIQGENKGGAAEYVADLPPGIVRQKAVNELISEHMKQGSEAVIEWVESIPSGGGRNFKRVAFQKAANALTIDDPVATARWIEDHLGRPYSSEAPTAIGKRWIEQDPVAAMSWLAGLPAGEAKDDAVSTSYRRWHTQAETEAEAWLMSATPSEGLDHAVRVLVRRHGRVAPTSALEWAFRIANEKRRERVVVGIAESWYRRDPEAADAWLGESGLSTETQAAIRSGAAQGARRPGAPRARAPGGG
jgi:hypothetical protein